MTMYYETVRSLLTSEPQTARQIAQQVFPGKSGQDFLNHKTKIQNALDDLQKHGIATSIKIDRVNYWTLRGIDNETRSTQTRIRRILSDGEWHSTRNIAEQIYPDFSDEGRKGVYITRTNVTLHRMQDKGIVDKMKGYGDMGRNTSAWRLTA